MSAKKPAGTRYMRLNVTLPAEYVDTRRVGTTTGRWPCYRLVVDGRDLGRIRRVIAYGRDGLAGRSQPRADGWEIAGTICVSRDAAEARLIGRWARWY